MNVGLPLGVLIGVVSGTAFLILTKTAENQPLRAVGALTALPATWFGGGWLTTVFDVEEILSWYVSSLCLTAVPISMVGLFFVIRDLLHPREAS